MATYFVTVYGKDIDGYIRVETSQWSSEKNAKWCVNCYRQIEHMKGTISIENKTCTIENVFGFEGKILNW